MPEFGARPSSTIDIPRLDNPASYRDLAYAALKRAITAKDIYDRPDEIRLADLVSFFLLPDRRGYRGRQLLIDARPSLRMPAPIMPSTAGFRT